MTSKEKIESAKAYLTRMEVWDEDLWVCALNIASYIARDRDAKYGRRCIQALLQSQGVKV